MIKSRDNANSPCAKYTGGSDKVVRRKAVRYHFISCQSDRYRERLSIVYSG